MCPDGLEHALPTIVIESVAELVEAPYGCSLVNRARPAIRSMARAVLAMTSASVS
jgi:hypothetical protein